VALLQSQIEGKYEILEKINEGGMGAVYKVRHRFLDEIRVVKVIRASLEPTTELSDRFLREARVAIRLRHPNIAALHDFAIAEGANAYIVMEYIEGLTLENVLRAHGTPPLGLTLEIAQQSLKAIGYLHRRGFVHRDIAPDNLMLTRGVEGEPLVKLIDLGIAKVLAGEGDFTSTGMFLGKPRYASPEHFGAEGGLDGRSDLYSFGVVLYELATGQPPVAGHDPASFMAGHLLRPPRDFAATDPAGRVPADLRELLLLALAKSSADRLASAEEFTRRLAPIMARYPVQDGDLEAALRPPPPDGQERPPGSAEVGSTQDRLDRQFGNLSTPSPESRGPTLVAPTAATMSLAQAGGAAAVSQAASEPRDALGRTVPLSRAADLPGPAARGGRAAAPGPPWETVEPAPGKGGAPPAPAARLAPDWQSHPLQPATSSTRDSATARPASAHDLRWQSSVSASGGGSGAASVVEDRGTWLKVALGAALILGALGGGTWWYLHPDGSSFGDAPGNPASRPAAPPASGTDASPVSPPGPAPGAAAAPGAAGVPGVAAAPDATRAGGPASAAAPASSPRANGPAPGARAAGPLAGTQAATPAAGPQETPAAGKHGVGKPAEGKPAEGKPAVGKPAEAKQAATSTSTVPSGAASRAPGQAGIPGTEREAERSSLIIAGPGVEVAEPTSIPDAVYPPAARGSGMQPRILVAVLVDEKGGVAEARIKSGDASGLGFNEAALEAVKHARFLPATRNGVAGRSWSELMIEFTSPP
jgi:TonB family protein